MRFLEKYHLEPRLFLAVFLEGPRATSEAAFLAHILDALAILSRHWRVLLVAQPLQDSCRSMIERAVSHSLIWVEEVSADSVGACVAHSALVVTDSIEKAQIATKQGVRCLFLGKNSLSRLVELGWITEHEPEGPTGLLNSFDEIIHARARTLVDLK